MGDPYCAKEVESLVRTALSEASVSAGAKAEVLAALGVYLDAVRKDDNVPRQVVELFMTMSRLGYTTANTERSPSPHRDTDTRYRKLWNGTC